MARIDAGPGSRGRAANLFRRILPRSTDDQVDPVVLGRVLLLASTLIVVAGVPVLDTADNDAWVQVGEAAAGLLGTFAASFALPWQRLSARATLLFPTVVCGTLVVLSLSDTSVYAPLAGLLSLCFAYIGLTQPPRTALAMLPVAGVAFLTVNGVWSVPILIRLIIACAVWAILGEVISRFTVRQNELSAALREAAHTDVLTGVANRRDLDLRLSMSAAGDTVVLCDLDHFKRLNDTFGHHAGDSVLADFGTMLRATVRGDDYAARYGGEEFLLLLPSTSPQQAEVTLARMRSHWEMLRPGVTFSAGLACCTPDRRGVETVAAADRALYEAKAAGRNCNRVEPEPLLRSVAS